MNLGRCREHLNDYPLPEEDRTRIGARLDTLLQRIEARAAELLRRIEAEPKSRAWRLRAKIGERKRWYEVPEEPRP